MLFNLLLNFLLDDLSHLFFLFFLLQHFLLYQFGHLFFLLYLLEHFLFDKILHLLLLLLDFSLLLFLGILLLSNYCSWFLLSNRSWLWLNLLLLGDNWSRSFFFLIQHFVELGPVGLICLHRFFDWLSDFGFLSNVWSSFCRLNNLDILFCFCCFFNFLSLIDLGTGIYFRCLFSVDALAHFLSFFCGSCGINLDWLVAFSALNWMSRLISFFSLVYLIFSGDLCSCNSFSSLVRLDRLIGFGNLFYFGSLVNFDGLVNFGCLIHLDLWYNFSCSIDLRFLVRILCLLNFYLLGRSGSLISCWFLVDLCFDGLVHRTRSIWITSKAFKNRKVNWHWFFALCQYSCCISSNFLSLSLSLSLILLRFFRIYCFHILLNSLGRQILLPNILPLIFFLFYLHLSRWVHLAGQIGVDWKIDLSFYESDSSSWLWWISSDFYTLDSGFIRLSCLNCSGRFGSIGRCGGICRSWSVGSDSFFRFSLVFGLMTT